jgi:hypothetical protein
MHNLCALLKAGALTGTPLTVIEAPDPDRWLAEICRPPPGPLGRSGKLGTPWERMQPANARPAARRAEAPAWPPVVGLEEPQALRSTSAAAARERGEANRGVRRWRVNVIVS